MSVLQSHRLKVHYNAKKYRIQYRTSQSHGRVLELGRHEHQSVGHFTSAPAVPPPFFISQNQAKDQFLPCLPYSPASKADQDCTLVVKLHIRHQTYDLVVEKLNIQITFYILFGYISKENPEMDFMNQS